MARALTRDLRLFGVTFAAIFVAEMGDKTQLATFSLAAGNRHARWMVFAGASLALITASGLACLLGGFLAEWVQGGYVTLAAAAMFAVLGLLFLLGYAEKGHREFAWLVQEIEKLSAVEKCRRCTRFATFLEHVRDVGSPTVSKKIDELLPPVGASQGVAATAAWVNPLASRAEPPTPGGSADDCADCSALRLHQQWHEKYEHQDEKPLV